MRQACACLALITVFAVSLAAGSPALAYEHLDDGGFERGGAGWDTSGVAIITSDAHEGTAYARAQLGADGAWLSSSAPGLLAAGPYGVRLALRGSDSSAEVKIFVATYGALGHAREVIAATSPPLEWTIINAGFDIVVASSAKIEIRVSGPAGAYIDVDAVSIDGAPPLVPTATPTFTSVPADAPASGITPDATVPVATASATPLPTVDTIGPGLRNAGFEELDAAALPLNWQKYGGALASDPRARSGERAARIESSTTSTKWLYQSVTVDAGATYAFAAWVLHDDAGVAAASLRISWYASADASGEALSTDDSTARLTSPSPRYRLLSTGAVAAPPGASSARLRVLLAPSSDTPAAIVVDDASFGTAAAVAPTATVIPATGVPPVAATGGSGVAAGGGSMSSRGGAATRDAVPPLNLSGSVQAVVINEVLYDAQGDAPDADAEWVELFNRSDVPMDIGGWTLRDASGVEVLPPLVVPARGFVIVAATDAFATMYPSYAGPLVTLGGRIGNALGNDGERLLLVDPGGGVVDAVSWGDDASVLAPAIEDVPAGHSFERRIAGVDSDSAQDFVDNHEPSPGRGFVAVEGNTQQLNGGQAEPQIQVLAGETNGAWRWLPWGALAVASAALAGAVAWRTVAGPRSEAAEQP